MCERRAFALVDARPLCAFRAAYGALMLVHIFRLHVHGMYSRAILQPALRFPYRILDVELSLPLPTTEGGSDCRYGHVRTERLHELYPGLVLERLKELRGGGSLKDATFQSIQAVLMKKDII